MKCISLSFLMAFLISCNGKISTSDKAVNNYQKTGDSISSVSQNVLMKNVSAAIKKGGTQHAIDFCSVRAIPLTDSLSEKYRVKIVRITDRNRNPDNALKTDLDRKVFASFSKNPNLKDSVSIENGKHVYYKRINLAMPTCTKCHGNPETEIAPPTLQKILAKYPADKAKNYQMGDFRGMWKLTFSN